MNHNCEAQTAESGSRTFEPMAARRSERDERVSRKALALSCLARAGRLNSLAELDGRASARFDLAREGEQSGFRARTRTSSCNALSQIVSLAAAHTETHSLQLPPLYCVASLPPSSSRSSPFSYPYPLAIPPSRPISSLAGSSMPYRGSRPLYVRVCMYSPAALPSTRETADEVSRIERAEAADVRASASVRGGAGEARGEVEHEVKEEEKEAGESQRASREVRERERERRGSSAPANALFVYRFG